MIMTLWVIALSAILAGTVFLVLKSYMSDKVSDSISRLGLVLMVKNQQDTVEGLVRNFYRGNFLRRIAPEMKVTVIDMGSTDETWNILLKLSKCYENLDILREEDRNHIFTYFNK